MAIFTLISTFVLPGAGAFSLFGLSPAVTNAIFTIGRSALWSLAGAALNQPDIPRQKVMATLSQTDGARIRAYGRNLLGGQRAFFEASGGRLHQVVVVHHGQVSGLIDIWVDGEKVETGATPAIVDGGGRINRYLTVYFRDGSGNGGDYAGVYNTGDSGNDLDWGDLTEVFPDLWTPQHRLEGQATYYAVLGDPADEDFQEYFPKGPHTNVQVEVLGSVVSDLSGTPVYSENAGLCIRDLLTHADGWNIPAARLNSASWASFAALCDEAVPLASGGTEPRYRMGGYYSLTEPLKDVTARMLATCDGQVYEDADGNIGILGGAWSEPDVTITAEDILSIEMDDGFDPRKSYNVLKGSFTSPDHAYQSTPVEEIRDEAALLTQERRVDSLPLDMCPSGTQLQRLMKIKFAKDRRTHVGTMRTNLVGLKARFPKGDGIHTIRVQAADEFGLDGVFEVTSHSFSIPDGFCEIGIASIDNPYPWDAATEEKPLPPGVNDLGKPDHLPPPMDGITLTQESVRLTSGVTGVRIVLRVNDPGRDDLELRAQVAEGVQSAQDPNAGWAEMSVAGYRAQTGILDDGQTYTVRLRWKRKIFQPGSDWGLAGTLTVTANPTPPAPPSQFGAMVTGSDVYLDWINPAADFYRTRIYRNTVSDFGTAIVVEPNVAGLEGQPANYTDEGLAPGTYYYWATTVNPSSVESTPAGPETVTI
ncbi:hypothetical protein [Paracoccus alkanivorans]|uniref:Fibronectin type-III domain-containing protein n=1 Tax=Paracoccus alkanivorans TaxID=2116655 RepID=A0A3M0MIS0_9RHOB|nr:hypothetical protein [Paracoccus alkanivorans]RMC37489.1 hypothetical protein C9E81_01690 [Paracoccus alkanivorans]